MNVILQDNKRNISEFEWILFLFKKIPVLLIETYLDMKDIAKA